jgi:hypothetical protein
MTPLASGLTPDEYWSLPAEKRPAGSVSDPRAVFAFTAVSLRVVLESFLLRDELERLLAEIKRHVLHDEKRPYLRQALDRMAQTARLLFGIRRDAADESTPARRTQKSNWKRELRITTGRAIHFGGSVCGGSYVEAAMMLAEGVVAAVCAMMPNQVNDIDDISEFLPRMPAPNEFPLLEYSIEKTVETINAVRLEWPDFDTFQHLCMDEFLKTVGRLGLRTPNGQPWLDFILTREPSETPPDDAGTESVVEKPPAPQRAGKTAGTMTLPAPPPPKFGGLTVSAAARRLCEQMDNTLTFGAAKKRITKNCDNGVINSAGKGRRRRVHPASLDSYILGCRNAALEPDVRW